jgi:hypothetical protein
MAGCKLLAGWPPEGKLDDGLAATALLDLVVFLAVVAGALELFLLAGGALMILAALGVDVVVHCHSPSALTQA